MTLAAHLLIQILLGQPVPPVPEQAADIPLRVAFEAPPGCSSAETFYSGVAARTNRVRLARSGERAHELRVRVTRGKTRVQGELTVLGVSGPGAPRAGSRQEASPTRVVAGSRCEEVVEALALTAALALDPHASLSISRSPSAAPGGNVALTPAPPASSAPPARVPSETSAAARQREPKAAGTPASSAAAEPPHQPAPDETSPTPLRVAFGLRALAARIDSTGSSFGAGLFTRVDYRVDDYLHPTLGISFLHVRNDLFETQERAGIHLTGVALSGCPVLFPLSVLRISPCAFALGGWLDAHAGKALEQPKSARRSYWSLGPMVHVSASVSPQLALDLEVALTFPLVERRFVAREPSDELTLISNTSVVAPFAGLGLAWAP